MGHKGPNGSPVLHRGVKSVIIRAQARCELLGDFLSLNLRVSKFKGACTVTTVTGCRRDAACRLLVKAAGQSNAPQGCEIWHHNGVGALQSSMGIHELE